MTTAHSAPWWQAQAGGFSLSLHIQPGAKKTAVAGCHGDALKIRLAAPPVDGRANDCLLRFLADWFAVPLRQVQLKQGELARRKVVWVLGSQRPAASLLDDAG